MPFILLNIKFLEFDEFWWDCEWREGIVTPLTSDSLLCSVFVKQLVEFELCLRAPFSWTTKKISFDYDLGIISFSYFKLLIQTLILINQLLNNKLVFEPISVNFFSTKTLWAKNWNVISKWIMDFKT
jgi:hypothetical protein